MPDNIPKDVPDSDKEKPPVPLSDLRRQLYARDESSTLKERDKGLRQLGIRRTTLSSKPEMAAPVAFKSIIDDRTRRRRKAIVVGAIAAGVLALFIAAVAGTLWYRARHNVKPEQIALALRAPTEFAAGDIITYAIDFENKSHVDWQQLEIAFEPSRGFQFISSNPPSQLSGKQYLVRQDALPAGQRGSIEIKGQLFGEQNATVNAKSELVFTPENFPSGRFTKAALSTTTISTVPINISLDARDDAESGERVLVKIQVRNNGSNALPGAYLKINTSPGIQIASEDTETSAGFSVADSRWELGTLEPLADITRTVAVFAEGQAGERRQLEAEVGLKHEQDTIVQRLQSHVITIAASALEIKQIYNDSEEGLTVSPGQKVDGIVRFSNIGNVGLKNAVVKVVFEGVGVDVATLDLKSGAYDPTTRTLTWTASTVPALATLLPRAEGSIPYAFSILPANEFPTEGEDNKNHLLIASASIDSPDLISATGEKRNLVSDRAAFSVATTLLIEASAFYDDGRLGLPSSGPVPPKAGEQTSYTVRFRIGSSLNDLGEVKMRAVLPDGVKYTGKKYVTQGELTFNDRTGELLWTIPQLEALTGRTKPPAELHVQIAITPGEHQRGNVIDFLNQLTAEGTDLFTDQTITEKLIKFPSTDTAVKGEGEVE